MDVVIFYGDASTGRLRATTDDLCGGSLRDLIHHEAGHFLGQPLSREIDLLAMHVAMVPRGDVESAARMVNPPIPVRVRRTLAPISTGFSSATLADEFAAETHSSQVIYHDPWRGGLIPVLDALRERILKMEVPPVHKDFATERLRDFHRMEDGRWRMGSSAKGGGRW